jgi:hypothetical protein
MGVGVDGELAAEFDGEGEQPFEGSSRSGREVISTAVPYST